MNILSMQYKNNAFQATFTRMGLCYWVKGVILDGAVVLKSHTCDFFIDTRDVKNQIKEMLYEQFGKKVN